MNKLGRLYIPDKRDKNFPMKSALPSGDSKRTYRYWWPSGWWGDQGSTPQCVAYSWMHYIEDGPVTHFYETNDESHEKPLIDCTWLYNEAQKIDEWPGENYDGTSVRAGVKILMQKGLIQEYRWTWNIEDVKKALLEQGPIVVGTWWHRDMFYPDKKGIISPTGDKVGGHAYLLNGINLDKGLIRIKNSWGRSWGKNGYAYIKIEDLDQLIQDQGEACLAVEKRIDI